MMKGTDESTISQYATKDDLTTGNIHNEVSQDLNNTIRKLASNTSNISNISSPNINRDLGHLLNKLSNNDILVNRVGNNVLPWPANATLIHCTHTLHSYTHTLHSYTHTLHSYTTLTHIHYSLHSVVVSSSSSNIFFNIDGLKATRLSGHSKINGVLPLSTFARVTCMHHQMNELIEGEKWRAHVFCE